MSEVYLGVVATVKAFDKENGNEFVRVEQMIYFKNGARREVNPYGALHDPPENEYRRLKYIEVYWEELHRRAVDAFSSAREDYLSTAHANANCGFPAPDIQEAEDELVKLTQRVNLCKRKLKLTREKMLATPEGQRLIQQEADMAESHAENEEFIQTIRRFRI